VSPVLEVLANCRHADLAGDFPQMVVRCLYCLTGLDFRVMTAYKDGRFVCRNCAHTVRPGVPDYRCTCHMCLKPSERDRNGNIPFTGGPLGPW
jgi:hypothetical protein